MQTRVAIPSGGCVCEPTGRGWIAAVCVSALALSSTGCLEATTQTHSQFVSRGTYQVPAYPGQRGRRRLALTQVAGKTRFHLFFSGRCQVVEVGEIHDTVERETSVSTLAIVGAVLLAGTGAFIYAFPYAEADASMKAGTVLIMSGGATYAAPAAQQTTTLTELPPKPAHRTLGVTDCPLRPIVGAEIMLRDAAGERTGGTNEAGTVEFDGAVGPDTKVYIDGRPAKNVVKP